MKNVSTMLGNDKVVPVVTIRSVEQALSLAAALQEGGINVIEVTLRTPAALDCIAALKRENSGMLVLAGTVTTPQLMRDVSEAGADGAISPAYSSLLLEAAKQVDMPFLPGVATPSEVLAGMEAGLDEFKLFPATAVGGLSLLKGIGAPMPKAKFCPTGGLNESNFTDFLALQNVMCVGGSWMVPSLAVNENDWAAVTSKVKHTLSRI